jgi:[ribosomal protein S5]-alanine N-acetyltransferase
MLQINLHPFTQLNTPRLLLRQFLPDDVADVFSFRSNAQAMQHIKRPMAKNISDTVNHLEIIDSFYQKNEAINWAICPAENPKKVMGLMGIFKIDASNALAEIGYMLHPNFWRKGFLNEALPATILFAFEQLQLNRLEAVVLTDNEASVKLLQKHGFTLEATNRQNIFWEGRFWDSYVFALLRADIGL